MNCTENYAYIVLVFVTLQKIKCMEARKIKLTDLEMNIGQIPGVPANPRQWTKDEMERLKKSIGETPELLEARGAIVYPHGGRYIVLGGNMRLSAVQALGWKEMPCIVMPADMPAEKLKEIVVKDNGSFGEWDMDALANEWDDLPLSDWGADVHWEDTAVAAGFQRTADEDDFDEGVDEIETKCRLGELWELGAHRLMCGDSTDTEVLEKLMGGGD